MLLYIENMVLTRSKMDLIIKVFASVNYNCVQNFLCVIQCITLPSPPEHFCPPPPWTLHTYIINNHLSLHLVTRSYSDRWKVGTGGEGHFLFAFGPLLLLRNQKIKILDAFLIPIRLITSLYIYQSIFLYLSILVFIYLSIPSNPVFTGTGTDRPQLKEVRRLVLVLSTCLPWQILVFKLNQQVRYIWKSSD